MRRAEHGGNVGLDWLAVPGSSPLLTQHSFDHTSFVDHSKQRDLVIFGHALVDVLASVTDEFIATNKLNKNAMQLIDTARAEELYAAMPPGIEISGGSGANTAAGAASFGANVAFVGRVADDQLGKVFAHDIAASGVQFAPVAPHTEVATGRSLILVTPDADRTMNTFLGAARDITPEHVDYQLVQSAKIVYLEGYFWDNVVTGDALHQIAIACHEVGTKVSLTLSDPFCVERWHQQVSKYVSFDVDILFGNRDELLCLYKTDDFDEALALAGEQCEVVFATCGSKGASVISHGERVDVPAIFVPDLVDTTGAGDLFAAGALYGLAKGLPLRECAQLGIIGAAEVIGHIGARPQVPLSTLTASALTN